MLARHRAKALFNQKEEKLKKKIEQDKQNRIQEESSQKQEIARRLHPKNNKDF